MSPSVSSTPPRRRGARQTSTLLTWGAIALVLVVVIGLVVVKLTQSPSTATGGTAWQPVSATVAHQVASIPEDVFDTVGVTSSVTAVNPPVKITGQPALTLKNAAGATVPGIVYYGAEWCPYCAAERWALVSALSRFGTFKGLGATTSSLTDVYPGTQTLTLSKATYTSDYVALQAIESQSNIASPSGGYTTLMVPTREQAALVSKYDTPQYVGGSSAGTIPFITIGNRYLVSGAGYSPAILAGLTRDEIAAGLDDPRNPATQAIVASANYLTAAICAITGGKPGNVCSSPGVEKASRSLSR